VCARVVVVRTTTRRAAVAAVGGGTQQPAVLSGTWLESDFQGSRA